MKKLLIIKPDHIGDYILFRNFLYELKSSEKYKNCHITFLGNLRVKELSEYLDRDIIDRFIWIDLEKYVFSSWYTKRKNQDILTNRYDEVINFLFPQSNEIDELVSNIDASSKIVIKLDRFYKDVHPSYTKIIDYFHTNSFIYETLKSAVKELTGDEIVQEKPSITLKSNELANNIMIDKAYVVIFIGSDTSDRKWSMSNYAKVIEVILNRFDVDVVICGGNGEIDDIELLDLHVKTSRVHNLVSQTSLVDMLYIISNSSFVISNETGIAHMAAALQRGVFVISNGNHFGRFSPYPQQYKSSYFIIYPFEYNETTFESYVDKYFYSSRLDINIIKSEDVIERILNLFEKYNIPRLRSHDNITINSLDYLLTSKQVKENFLFSESFSKVYDEVLKLKETNEKYVIYGNSHFAKVIRSVLEDSVLGMVDKSSSIIDESISLEHIYSPKSLVNFSYDKIIVAVLGRENDIQEYLINECNVSKDKIIVFKIIRSRYVF